MIKFATVLIIILTAGFVGFVRYLEKTSVFFPSRSLRMTPASIGLKFEDVYFVTEDGLRLHGWWVPSPGAEITLLFLHGNAGNISDRVDKIALLLDLGLNIFIIDYRGYGLSEGQPSEEGLYRDAVAAFDYISRRSESAGRPIVVYGASLGGAVAIDLATRRDPSALIIESSFSSATDMAQLLYPFVPSFLIGIKMHSIGKVQGIAAPKLFLHSPEDETVPLDLGKKLFKAAAEPKEFIELRGGHNDGHVAGRDIFIEAMRNFLRRWNLIKGE